MSVNKGTTMVDGLFKGTRPSMADPTASVINLIKRIEFRTVNEALSGVN